MKKHRQYLNSFKKFRTDKNFKPGPERVEAALSQLDSPHKKLKVIHITGTNGKGSTATMIASIMEAAGYNTGLFLSPHLQDIRERFQINGEQISETELKTIVEMIKPAIENLSNMSGPGRPILFEVLTILAFQYFAYRNVDVVVMEVGMGGRLDPTNVVIPLISIITSIGLDHTEYLGDTLTKIAREKAGIIKENRPVVTGVREREPLTVIKKVAREKESTLFCPLDEADWQVEYEDFCKQQLDLTISGKHYPVLEVGLVGYHQIYNTIIAIKTVEILQEYFPEVNKQAIYRGLRYLALPGRLELIQERPLVLLDSAHNKEGMTTLVDFLQGKENYYNRLFFILSILKDKDIISMVKQVMSVADKIIFTKNHSFRAINASELAESVVLKNNKKATYLIINELNQAIEQALTTAATDDLICITGSLKTIAEAREYFNL